MSYSFVHRPSILMMATMALSLNLFSTFALRESLLLEEDTVTSKEEQDFLDPMEVKNLDVSNKNLTEFDSSQYPNLDTLDISNNKLENLNTSRNTVLMELNCSNNQLKDLTFASDNIGLWILDCSNNCLPALALDSFSLLRNEECKLSGQTIVLPKNLTTFNLEKEFPQIMLSRMKKINPENGIIFNPTTGDLTEIKPNSTFSYSYATKAKEEDQFLMEVTLSFTGEEDPTISPPEEPVSKPDPLPPFTGGNTSTDKDDSDLNVEVKEIPMHRLYNPNTGEHLYTADTNERNTLTKIGWNSEGIGWIAPETSSIPVYRLYNPITEGGDHHYTMDIKERDTLRILGWKYEDVGWYSVNEKDPKAVPLYRQYNPNQYAANHNYTVDRNEHVTLIRLGWKDEGTAWYGLKSF